MFAYFHGVNIPTTIDFKLLVSFHNQLERFLNSMGSSCSPLRGAVGRGPDHQIWTDLAFVFVLPPVRMVNLSFFIYKLK